jgi:hypothetical protein
MAGGSGAGDPDFVDMEYWTGHTPAVDQTGAAVRGRGSPPRRPWYLHPYPAIGLMVVGVVLGAFGATRFVAAGSEREARDAGLGELADLEATEARLRSDADAVREEIEAIETATAGTRDEIAAVNDEIAALQEEIAETEAEIAETETPIRDLQEAVWEVYSALQQTAEIQSQLDDTIESAVMAGNQRQPSIMTDQVERVQTEHLPALDEAIDALDAAIAGTQSNLVGAGASLEITEEFGDGAAGWEAGFESNGLAGAAAGAYEITADDPLTLMWGLSPYEVADVNVEVNAQPTAGGDAGQFAYGVLCRAEKTPDYLGGYLFAVTGEGGWLVGRYRPPGEWVDMADGWHATVNRGLEANEISVTCSGSDLVFEVNGVILWRGNDLALNAGSVALGAYFWGDDPVTVVFDDLRLSAGGES